MVSVDEWVGWQMAIESSVSNYFWSTFVDSINILDCRLPLVIMFSAAFSPDCAMRIMKQALVSKIV